MIDLACLVADKSIEATFDSLLKRPEALRIRAITSEIVVHPERDPGCFHDPGQLLGGFTGSARQALVVLDHAWEGVPAEDAPELERLLEERLRKFGPPGWARALVIEPELDVWVFSDSPHVAEVLGWRPPSTPTLRNALEKEGLWEPAKAKPEDPKGAMDWTLRRAGLPRSSALFRKLASQVSLRRCQDRSFQRLMDLFGGWFGPVG